MRLLKKRCKNKPKSLVELITNANYRIKLDSVISKSDCMIVRCKVRLPHVHNQNISISVKTESGEKLPTKCIFMGRIKCDIKVNDTSVFTELTFSVFVPYLQEDVIFSIMSDEKVEHEQAFSKDMIEQLRFQTDKTLYTFCINDPYYAEWLNNHRATEIELELQRKTKFNYEPKFSIIVPLYKTPIAYFSELMESIKCQTYSNWELILVNASPEDVILNEAVARECEKDARIVEITLSQNEGITLNTAYGIERSTGEYVCFVDHDDIIEPNCLFEYVNRINESGDCDVLYCDEDLKKPDGSFSGVYFKPDFSLHLLRSNNCVCHMLAIKKDLLVQLEYKNNTYDGAQDHHLTLQAVEKTNKIEHIQKVLYHWRVSENSTAGGSSSKPYATKAGIEAVKSHLKREKIDAKVLQHPTVEFSTKIEYAIPQESPLVSIIIPTKDNVNLLKNCISSVKNKTTYDNYEILIIENNSEENETFHFYETLKESENVHVYNFDNEFNFSKIINFGRSKANGQYLILLNNDTEVISESWIENMLGICSQKDVGIVGCKLLFPDETIQHAGVFIGNEPYHLFHHLPNGAINYLNFAEIQREVSAVTAACMMVDVKTFDEVGGFNEEFRVDYNDIDFCFRVRKANKLIIYTPFSQLYHYESISRGIDSDPKGQTRRIYEVGLLKTKWADKLAFPDPYHTPCVRQSWEGAYYSF